MSDNLSQTSGLTMALNSGALAEGTNANTIQIATAINYVIDGRFYSKAITDNIAISYSGPAVFQASAGGVQNVNGGFTGGVNGSTRIYGIYLDTSGAVSILPGPIVDNAELAAGRVSLQWPDVPAGVCPIGGMRIGLTAGVTFTPGQVDLGAANVTDTFYNLAFMPANPLTA
ncbi:hypothetical protein EBQ81_05675 [bacterium]|nr:hypothetical protein [bacterium]